MENLEKDFIEDSETISDYRPNVNKFASWDALLANAALSSDSSMYESVDDKSMLQKIEEELAESKNMTTAEKRLCEGTSNFYSMDELPLLIFESYEVVYDRVYDMTIEELDLDGVSDPEDDDRWESTFEKIWDENFDYCVLDESEVDELRSDIDDFNYACKYDSDVDIYEYDIAEVEIRPGYYEALQLFCETKYLDEKSVEKVQKFFDEMKDKYNLTELGVSYRASNGETGYHKK